MTETLSVYSDFVCPFCYLGRESLREYVDESTEPPDVQWELFDLRGYKRAPDGSIQNVARLQEEYDAEMVSLDTIGEVDSWNAQQAALFVRQTEDEETFTAFYDTVFDALWQEGRDIGDPDVLADIAEGVGIDPDAVRDATEDPQLESELKNEFEAAQQRGITGIPTFVYDGHAARGAVPPEHLKRLMGET